MKKRAPSAQLRATSQPISEGDLTLEDLESVRHLLRGDSVVDWHRLDFREHADVDRFLRVNEFDPQNQTDMDQLENLRGEAVEYLTEAHSLSIPERVATEIAPRDLFLVASRKGPGQMWSCVILKVMHIIHHLAGQELLNQLQISSDEVYQLTELKVMQVVEEMKAAGFAITEFQWSRKLRHSLITKLLAKRSTLAANIYDKLRFRLVVKDQADILPTITALTRRMIPFNYVIPGESVNHLISFRDLVQKSDDLRRNLGKRGDQDTDDGDRTEPPYESSEARLNEFSAKSYRIINFVADLPLRVDEHISEDSPAGRFGNVVFVMTEFQITDVATRDTNETGDGNHEAYKSRQYRSVQKRLLRGRRTPRYTGEVVEE